MDDEEKLRNRIKKTQNQLAFLWTVLAANGNRDCSEDLPN